MIQNINENFAQGRYDKQLPMESAKAYSNSKGGWTDYLLADKIIFSHRINDYMPASFPEYLHSHDFYELILCVSGDEMQYIAENQYLSARPGTAILTKPMNIHMFRAMAPLHYDRYVIYFHNSLHIFSDRNVMNFLSSGNDTNASFYFPEKDDILKHAREMEEALSDSTSPYACAQALLHLLALFITLSKHNPISTELISSPPPAFICEIKQYIDEEFVNIHSVTELTGKFYYSREYITRIFRQYYNTPLYDYILRRKLLYSCTLLRQGFSVEKAALQAGFRNMSSFIKVFRKSHECTPSEYRAKHFSPQ